MNINIFLVTLLTGCMVGSIGGVMAADRDSIPGGQGDVDINVSRVSRTCSVVASGNNQELGTVYLTSFAQEEPHDSTVFNLQGCQGMTLTLTMQAEATSSGERYHGIFPGVGGVSDAGNYYVVALKGNGVSGGEISSYGNLVPLDNGPADRAIMIKPDVSNYSLEASTYFIPLSNDGLMGSTPGSYNTWYTYNFTYI
ncbi:type 1 fimbrial protein [Salmonella enterica subsp. enterica serovar Durban]|nr:type 1 fimbrial protein [Salmonella enterica]EEE1373441.1 type 1 fimbrial protein [Salmonella enterica subsp. enterica serovar Durban]